MTEQICTLFHTLFQSFSKMGSDELTCELLRKHISECQQFPIVIEKTYCHFTTLESDTLLSYACRKGYLQTARLLIEYGADVNGKIIRYSPLMRACIAGHTDCAKLLIAKGADVNQMKHGESALTLLFTYIPHGYDQNSINCAELLLDNGANMNISAIYYETIFVQACRLGIPQLIQLLRFLIKADYEYDLTLVMHFSNIGQILDTIDQVEYEVETKKNITDKIKAAADC